MTWTVIQRIKSRRRPLADVSDDRDLIAFFNEARSDRDRTSVARLARARARARR